VPRRVRPSGAIKDLIDTPEPQLVELIFSQIGWVDGIGNPPQTPGPIDWRLAVDFRELRVPNGAAGDVDALIISAGALNQARAVQFKRIKVGEHALLTSQPNKLTELRTLVRQTNLLHEIGFAFVWSTVVVTTDIRSQVSARGAFASTPANLMEKVSEAFPRCDLRDGIGVSICDINQVSDAPAHQRGSASSRMVRHADRQDQPEWLTKAIADVFSRPGAT